MVRPHSSTADSVIRPGNVTPHVQTVIRRANQLASHNSERSHMRAELHRCRSAAPHPLSAKGEFSSIREGSPPGLMGSKETVSTISAPQTSVAIYPHHLFPGSPDGGFILQVPDTVVPQNRKAIRGLQDRQMRIRGRQQRSGVTPGRLVARPLCGRTAPYHRARTAGTELRRQVDDRFRWLARTGQGVDRRAG